MRPAVPATHSSASCSARPRRRVPSIVELEAAVTLIERISSGLSSAIQLGIRALNAILETSSWTRLRGAALAASRRPACFSNSAV